MNPIHTYCTVHVHVLIVMAKPSVLYSTTNSTLRVLAVIELFYPLLTRFTHKRRDISPRCYDSTV
jgi:hypothetical protein